MRRSGRVCSQQRQRQKPGVIRRFLNHYLDPASNADLLTGIEQQVE
jgi:hypothetical protein